MADTAYLALLRGINVGGNNIIKMVDLKACFENMGFSSVITYIQSGNVIFKSNEKNISKLEKHIEQVLSKTFNYQSKIILLTHEMLKRVVEESPPNFGKSPEKQRYDVIFIKAPLTCSQAIKDMPHKEGVDCLSAATHSLYFSRLISKASQSQLSKVIKLPIYKNMSIRNWNTTSKLLTLMDSL